VREAPVESSPAPVASTDFSARERANFGFLESYDLNLAEFALQAERFCLWDPCAALFKLRLFVERMAKLAGARIFPHWNFREDLFRLLQRLEEYGVFGPEVGRAFHRIRKLANTAVHYGLASREEALGALRLAHGLALWFARSNGATGEDDRAFPVFQEPRERSYGVALLEDRQFDWRGRVEELEEQVRQGREESTELGRLRELATTEAQMAQLRLQEAGAAAQEIGAWDLAALAGFTREKAPKPVRAIDRGLAEAFAQRCREAEALMTHQAMPLDQARWMVEQELRESGWQPDGPTRFTRDWPTYAGPADYVLFHGQTPLAVLALRPNQQELNEALAEAIRWSECWVFQPGEVPSPGAPWGMARVPWALAAKGHDPANSGLLGRELRAGADARQRKRWPKVGDLV
jgi:type I restriction enzyme R subunit